MEINPSLKMNSILNNIPWIPYAVLSDIEDNIPPSGFVSVLQLKDEFFHHSCDVLWKYHGSCTFLNITDIW
jgi:hypothetical protein